MRILHVIDSAGLYGAEVVLLSLMESQIKFGLKPCLLSLGDILVGSKDIEVESVKKSVETHSLRFRNGLNLKGAVQIVRKAHSLGAQIIHSHGYKSDILLGLLPSHFRKIPVIATIHGWTSMHFLTKIWFYEVLDAIALRNLDAVVAVTSLFSCRFTLRALGIRPKVINNGLPALSFRAGEFEREFPDVVARLRGHFNILSVGRLSGEKGFDILIRAIGDLRKQNYNISLAIIGEGNQKTYLQKLINSMSLNKNILLLGYQKDIFRYMPDFDLFVIPSRTEGLPVTLLEAMQAGLPVVATRVGEIPKVLREGQFGELVSPDDSQALAEAIVMVYKNRGKAKEKAILGQKTTLEEYSADRMAASYLRLYKTVLREAVKSF